MEPPESQRGTFPTSKEEFCRFCGLVYQQRLSAGAGGNVALRCGDRIWLTPTGCSLRDLHPESIAVVDREGRLIQGSRPTKEANMHLGVLRVRPEVHAVLHVHGAYLIASSTLLTPGPCSLPALTPGFVYHAFPLPMIPFKVPGSPDLASDVTQALSRRGTSAVLLQNHGLVTVGKDLWEALDIAEEIDEAARVYVLTAGKASPLGRMDIDGIKSIREG